MNKIKLRILLSSILLLSSSAFANSECGLIPHLQRESRAQIAKAQAYEEYHNNILEIANDAKVLTNKSSTLAISSGLLFLGVGAMTLGETAVFLFPGHLVPTRFLVAGNAVGRALPAILGGQLGVAASGGSEVAAFVGAMIGGHIDSIFFIGSGLYQIVSDGKEYQIDYQKLNNLDYKIKTAIDQISDEIGNKIDNPPSTISNSLSFGGKNYRHFKEIFKMAEVRSRLQYDLANLTKSKVQLLESVCK